MLHALLARTFLGYTTNILTAAPPRTLDFAGAAIDGMPTWRSEFRAAVAATDNGEFNESIVQGIAAGISFIKRLVHICSDVPYGIRRRRPTSMGQMRGRGMLVGRGAPSATVGERGRRVGL